jgi:hypothetical protein
MLFSLFRGKSITTKERSDKMEIKIRYVDPVVTGKTWDKTPVGFFKVVNKIKNRPYYIGHIPDGDLRNPLGKRWLGLNANGTYGGYIRHSRQ